MKACAPFIYTENLIDSAEDKPSLKADRKTLRGDAALVHLLREAVSQTSDDESWAMLSTVGSYLTNNSSFSPLNYGYRKLSELIRVCDLFEMDVIDSGLRIRDKKKPSKVEHLFYRFVIQRYQY
ncbi:OST-HTH/LOTUS domain-containing protein [Teredinibacter sp. KSP-S5-2]|uniref:OST-HTH/LOTUS domain-containing protein n=1 Tax=Teredinibacter sp. KSP-S5-2 TaxID=3034506 RepID=UPI002934B21C|nr:OST-HTH/LOTUS domain-containing protein [Teredinibacter sp. KSP-S5-2]WNO10580.1 OST-HTH/LOTUS domain-containing protein [Teredinibacter sp. KSP-S5-2]